MPGYKVFPGLGFGAPPRSPAPPRQHAPGTPLTAHHAPGDDGAVAGTRAPRPGPPASARCPPRPPCTQVCRRAVGGGRPPHPLLPPRNPPQASPPPSMARSLRAEAVGDPSVGCLNRPQERQLLQAKSDRRALVRTSARTPSKSGGRRWLRCEVRFHLVAGLNLR